MGHRVFDAGGHGRIQSNRFVMRGDRGVEQTGITAGVHQAREQLRVMTIGHRVLDQAHDGLAGAAVLGFEVRQVAMRERQVRR